MWGPFLNLLNRPNGFIMNMTSRIIAKIACWSQELMDRSDLQFYLTWLKDQLKQNVTCLYTYFFPPLTLCNWHHIYMNLGNAFFLILTGISSCFKKCTYTSLVVTAAKISHLNWFCETWCESDVSNRILSHFFNCLNTKW